MIANSDGWIEWIWTEDKPYPESLDTKEILKYLMTCITDTMRRRSQSIKENLIAKLHCKQF